MSDYTQGKPWRQEELDRAAERADERRAAKVEPWDEVFAGKPDLIASGRSDNAAVLLKMSRLHANILGAYLNGRNDIAPLPPLVVEVLEALTLRLVQPGGSRWADLRTALQGQAVILPHQVDWKPLSERNPEHFPKARHRRRDAGDPSDLRADLRPAELGDVDGTTVHEMFGKEEK